MFSGSGFRIVCFIIFITASILYTWRYARKVKNDPTKSVIYGCEISIAKTEGQSDIKEKRMTIRHKLCVVIFIITMVMVVYGTSKLGWYIDELAALFLMMMIVMAKVGGLTFEEIAENLVEAFKAMAFGVIVCGLSRGVLQVLQEAQITDTIVYPY